MELKEYLNVVKRYWWILALFLLVSWLGAFIYTTYYVKPVYEASTDLIVNKTAETASGQLQIDQNSINTNLMLINTYKQIVMSPAIMKRVAETNPGFQLTAEELGEKVKVNSMKDTQVLTIVAQDASYEKAVQIVNAVSAVFRERAATVMKVNSLSVLNEADAASEAKPINANHNVLYIFSMLAALLLGLGVIFLLDYLDDTVKSDYDVEQLLGLTLLAKINKVSKKDLAGGPQRASGAVKDVPVLRPIKEQR